MDRDLEGDDPLTTAPDDFHLAEASSSFHPTSAPAQPSALGSHSSVSFSASSGPLPGMVSSPKRGNPKLRENSSDAPPADSGAHSAEEQPDTHLSGSKKHRRAPKRPYEAHDSQEASDDDETAPLAGQAEQDDRQALAFDEAVDARGQFRRRCLTIPGMSSALSVLTASWLNFGAVVLPFPFIVYLANWNRGVLLLLSLLVMFPASSLVVCHLDDAFHLHKPWERKFPTLVIPSHSFSGIAQQCPLPV